MIFVRSVIAAICVALLPSAAQAALVFCNKTSVPIEAAIAYRDENQWVSEGWWKIQPGQCARAYSHALSQRFYFYYARALATSTPTGKAPPIWSGKYTFCIDRKAFRVEGDESCESQGYQTQGFQQIDIGANARDYTLTFEGF